MAKYIGTILTKKGKELLVRATLGEIITFTKVEIGKGIIPEGTNKEDLGSLIESFKTLSITSTTILEAGNYRVRVAFNNSGILEDTYLREIGLFARGEDGIEVLYSYCDTAIPDLIPRESSGILERVEDIITYISSAGTVNAVIDQSNVYATIKDLTEGLLTKENKFTKNSGFNLVISHVVDTASKVLVASALAVKTAYDKALEAIGFTNTNKNAIQNNTEQIENWLNDAVEINQGVNATSGSFHDYGNDLINCKFIVIRNMESGSTLLFNTKRTEQYVSVDEGGRAFFDVEFVTGIIRYKQYAGAATSNNYITSIMCIK